MNRRDIVETFAQYRADAVVVLSPGRSSGLLFEADSHPATIYNMELAYASAVAMGIALGVPERNVVALEGDGSLFAGATVLGTIARYPQPNLTILVIANGIWGTGDGSIETATARTVRLTALALACGWEPAHVTEVADRPALSAALRRALAEPGPWFISAIAEPSPDDRSGQRPRVLLDAVEAVDLTRRWLRDARKRSAIHESLYPR